MYPSVTAILIVHDGAGPTGAPNSVDHLTATLDAIARQTRRPDTIIAVACDAPQRVLDALQAAGVTQIVTSSERLSFGQAIEAGVRVTTPPRDSSQMLWMLAQDTAPAPDALAKLVGALEVSPSVAVVGPKLIDGRDEATIVSLGETITRFGSTVELVEDELDQGQHDTESDVMAVAPAGLLVRHSVWNELGGFDLALTSADDSLDFCVRARLAGHRVAVVPEALVYIRGDGVAGARRSARASVRRRRARQLRAAQLHRRLVYAPGGLVWLHWLSILPLAVARALWRLIAKQPDVIGAEFAAAGQAAFGRNGVTAARRRLQSTKTASWSALRELRIPAAEVRRRNRLRRESSAAFYTVERSELNFFGGGGAWVVLASAVVSAAIFAPLLAATTLEGGALLPLSESVGALWSHVGWVWHDIGLGFVGAADPFAAVLAILGTLTFWDTSFSLVLLWLLALPLATLGGWFAATRLTERSGIRIVTAVLWTVAPPLIAALVDGRPAAVIVHLLLPWLFYAGSVAARSWAAAGAASILAAAVIACAPSLAPAMVVLWIVVLVLSGRQFARAIWLIIPTAVLWAPLIVQQGVQRGNWMQLLADPGRAVPFTESTGWQLAAGLPSGESGWVSLMQGIQVDRSLALIVIALLLAPLVLVAAYALFRPGSTRAVVLLAIGLLGLVTAVASAQLSLALVGADGVSVWPGAGLSLYWLGVGGAAVVGLDGLGRRALVPAIVVPLLAALVAAPLAATVLAGISPVRAADGRTLPAYVAASAQADSSQGILRITPLEDGSISVILLRGAGQTLDQATTLATTDDEVNAADRDVAELSGNLVSQSGLDTESLLADLGIRFVVVTTPTASADGSTGGAERRYAQAAAALDANPALALVGPTDRGTLWRYDGEVAARDQVDPAPWVGTVVAVSLITVFAIALLLSVPTAASRRIAEMTPRTVGRRAGETREPRSPAEKADEIAESEAEASVENELADGDSVAPTDASTNTTADVKPAPAAPPAATKKSTRSRWFSRTKPTVGGLSTAEPAESAEPAEPSAEPKAAEPSAEPPSAEPHTAESGDDRPVETADRGSDRG